MPMAWCLCGSNFSPAGLTSTRRVLLEGGDQLLQRQFDAGLEAVDGLFRPASAASRLSLTASSSPANFSTANLCALAMSSWARRRMFSPSALARSQASWCSAAFSSSWRNCSSRLGRVSMCCRWRPRRPAFVARFVAQQGFLGVFVS